MDQLRRQRSACRYEVVQAGQCLGAFGRGGKPVSAIHVESPSIVQTMTDNVSVANA